MESAAFQSPRVAARNVASGGPMQQEAISNHHSRGSHRRSLVASQQSPSNPWRNQEAR